MVSLEKKMINGKAYYYIATSKRVAGKVKRFTKYLGVRPPEKDSEKYKKLVADFEIEIKQKLRSGLAFLKPEDIEKLNKLKKEFNERKIKIDPSLIERFKKDFITSFTYNSNAIEGNTMTELEVTTFLKDGITPPEKNLREIYETRNHAEAIKFVESYKGKVNKKFLLDINKIILKDIKDRQGGRYRRFTEEVRIGNDLGCPSARLEKEMKNFFLWFNKMKKEMHPFEFAVLAHFKLVEIHPFCDGNGRTARLIMNFILRKNDYPYLIILSKKRLTYYKTIYKARRANYHPLLKFCFKTMVSNPILNTLLGKLPKETKK